MWKQCLGNLRKQGHHFVKLHTRCCRMIVVMIHCNATALSDFLPEQQQDLCHLLTMIMFLYRRPHTIFVSEAAASNVDTRHFSAWWMCLAQLPLCNMISKCYVQCAKIWCADVQIQNTAWHCVQGCTPRLHHRIPFTFLTNRHLQNLINRLQNFYT